MSGTITVETGTLESTYFLEKMKKFKHFRVRFETSDRQPFKYVYFRINKKELKDNVRMNRQVVTYEIKYNSRVQKDVDDIVYIMKTKSRLIEEIHK